MEVFMRFMVVFNDIINIITDVLIQETILKQCLRMVNILSFII
ncbi:MAG: hypothetical protein AB2417_01715 [Clostridiaceae bacterium]